MTQPEIAAAMGVSLSTVNRAHMAYDRSGLKALEPKPIGGRMRENMTLKEEAALLAGFAKVAGAGEMLNIHDFMFLSSVTFAKVSPAALIAATF
jgi:hypothetical protein